MTAIRDCLWKRNQNREEREKGAEEIIYYGCGHYESKGELHFNPDERHGILTMIKDGFIPKPKEAECALCIIGTLKLK